MKSLGEKLKKIRTDNGLTMDELIVRLNEKHDLNISKSMVSRWENGHAVPLNMFVAAYAKEFGIDMNYLIGLVEHNFVELPKRTVKIPVLGSVPAGVPIEAIENILYEVDLDADIAKNGRYFGLVIKGNSMSPQIMDQDLVIVRQQEEIESGEIAVAYINGYEATCKKILMTETGIILQPLNPEYPPQAYTWDQAEKMPVRIIGKVVQSRRDF